MITISAGNSDVDSQVWVDMLLRMYSYWCDTPSRRPSGYRHHCKLRLVDESLAEWGGFNYAVLEISGKYAYGYLKSEQGIHQLRQISPFSFHLLVKILKSKLALQR